MILIQWQVSHTKCVIVATSSECVVMILRSWHLEMSLSCVEQFHRERLDFIARKSSNDDDGWRFDDTKKNFRVFKHQQTHSLTQSIFLRVFLSFCMRNYYTVFSSSFGEIVRRQLLLLCVFGGECAVESSSKLKVLFFARMLPLADDKRLIWEWNFIYIRIQGKIRHMSKTWAENCETTRKLVGILAKYSTASHKKFIFFRMKYFCVSQLFYMLLVRCCCCNLAFKTVKNVMDFCRLSSFSLFAKFLLVFFFFLQKKSFHC